MTYDMQNTDKLAQYKRELGRLGIPLLPPDINQSVQHFSVENGAVRYALSAVKGSGEATANAVVAERNANGAYKSVSDFVRRVDASNLDRKSMEAWIKAGAFDSFEKKRGLLFANLTNLMQHAKAAVEEKNSSQISLFGGTAEENPPIVLTPAKDWNLDEKLAAELSVIGFYLSAHPLDKYASALERLRAMTYAETARIAAKAGQVRAKIALTVNSVREKISQKGTKFAFISASDSTGGFEMMAFSEMLNLYRDLLKSQQPLLVSVAAEKKEDADAPRMIVQNVENLEELISKMTDGLMVCINKPDAVAQVKDIFSRVPFGRTKVWVVVQVDDWEVEVLLEKSYALSAEVMSELRKSPGVNEIREI